MITVGVGVNFIEIVRRARTLLREEGRITLRGLKSEFDLDDDALEELVDELVDGQQVAVVQFAAARAIELVTLGVWGCTHRALG